MVFYDEGAGLIMLQALKKNDESAERKAPRAPTPPKYQYTFMFSKRRKKAVMAVLVGVVVITFVIGFGGAMVSCFGEGGQTADKVASLGGKPVTATELQEARRDAYIHLCLGIGVRPDTPQFSLISRKTAWRRLASLRFAAKLGLTVSEKELQTAMKDQFTDRNGTFNAVAYNNFATRTLPSMRILPQEFSRYLRGALILQKLERILGSATAWIPPADLSREMTRFTDSFVISCVNIDKEQLASDDPAVSEDEAKEFFAQNAKALSVPDRVRVKYVSFVITNFMSKVNSVAESRAKDYYQSHRSEFTMTTNGTSSVSPFEKVKDQIQTLLVNEDATNYYDDHKSEYTSVDTNDVETLTPFSTVRASILEILKKKDATTLAEDKAMEFTQTMNPGRDGLIVQMDRAAAQAGIPVYTSSYFGRYEEITGIDVPFSFNRDAFDLVANDPRDHFSNPILGKDAVFVISYGDKVQAHIPDFKEVSDKVYKLAKAARKQKQIAQKADDVRKALKTSLDSGKSFTEAAKSQKLTPESAGPFTWISSPTNITISAALMESICLRRSGELTEPVPGSNGVSIAFVVSRVPGLSDSDLRLGQYLAESMREEKTRRLFMDWQQRLVAREKDVIADTADLEGDAAKGTDQPASESPDGPATLPLDM